MTNDYVVGRVRHILEIEHLEYIAEIRKIKDKYHISWCSTLDLAQSFNFGIHIGKHKTKLALERMLKEWGIYGKVEVYEIETRIRVKNKVINAGQNNADHRLWWAIMKNRKK